MIGKDGKVSYAQCGEDIIVEFVLEQLGITKPYYLDLGAHHPTYLSNTYMFYRKRCQGVCIEPDPNLAATIKRKRSRDVVLPIGVGAQGDELTFYKIDPPTLNTFSKSEAERYVEQGHKIKETQVVRVRSINDVLENECSVQPDFVSLDVEGLDLEIIKAWDFKTYRPPVFCIETLTYTADSSEGKIRSIIKYMETVGYMVYADTYINTIFVDKKTWSSR